VAGRRRKRKINFVRFNKGDFEALSLILFAVSFFLIVSLYPPSPYSGDWGLWLKQQLLFYLGVLAYLLPFPITVAGILLLLQKPLKFLIRHTLFATIVGFLLLPYCNFFCPDYAGHFGKTIAIWLQNKLGNAGYLLPAFVAWAVVDVWLRKPPFWGVLTFFKAGFRSGARLTSSLFLLIRDRRKYYDLRRAAKIMKQEVDELASQHPDHDQLISLSEDLERIIKRPLSEDEDNLLIYRNILKDFQQYKATELIQKLHTESGSFLVDIDTLFNILKLSVNKSSSSLFSELHSRKKALLLELTALKKQYLRLQRASERDSAKLQADYRHLARVEKSLNSRRNDWRNLYEAYEEVANRVEAWQTWVDWAEKHPEEYHPAALQVLKQLGISAQPPNVLNEETKTITEEIELASEEIEIEFEKTDIKPNFNSSSQNLNSAGVSVGPPPADLLDPPEEGVTNEKLLETEAENRAKIINETLSHFNLQARVVAWARGPSVTRFEVEPAPGEKISRIAGLANDIARALAVGSVRVEAPIPGKRVIGLEVPNAERQLVRFSEALAHPAYARSKARLPLILGKSIDGEMWVRDLAGMPHLLIAGSTGSGKSVCVNTLVMSLLYRYQASELRFLMIDPKMVELTPYDGIPHLVRGVVTNPADAAGVLLGAVAHMERRYKMMSQVGARNLEQFNAKMRELGEPELPMLVIVIDELADLMITSPKEVEQAILRLAQMARATGMHLILATQRPSVDILTSLIKVNIPARIAFAVSSSHDSRTILDSTGAERLIGQGDMLFHQPGLAKPVRLQGPFLSDREIRRVTDYLRAQDFDDAFGEAYGADFDGPLTLGVNTNAVQGELPLDFSDPYLRRAAEIVVEEGQASVSRLQRRLSVGHARAGKLMDLLEAMGIVGPHQGSKPREVLISSDQLQEYFG